MIFLYDNVNFLHKTKSSNIKIRKNDLKKNYDIKTIHRLNFERPNVVRLNFERPNFKRPNFQGLKFEKD
jgi:hypothetical protein